MKKIFLSLLIGTSNLLVAQLSTSEIVATGNHVSLQDIHSITLKPGFWAKSGSTFLARIISYDGIKFDCPIVTEQDFAVDYINANSYDPEAIDIAKKLTFGYDTAANISRIYFANAGSTSGGNSHSLEAIKSLIYVYPNPTKGTIRVVWDSTIDHLISRAVLGSVSGISVPLTIKTHNGQREGIITFSGPTGVYGLRIWLTDGRDLSITIIKN